MKKILLALLAVTAISSIGFASNTSSRCRSLLQQTKGTEKEKIAIQTCGTSLDSKKVVSKRIIGKIPTRSDTKISSSQVKEIVASSVIMGNKDARFLIIEYSDLQCPFCQTQWNNGIMKSLIDKYKGKVATTFRHFPLEFHQYADIGAFAAECVASQDKNKYYDFINGVFSKGLDSETVLYDIAQDLKLDVKKLKSCMSETAINQKVATQIIEALNLFGVTGTPGNVILDRGTGKYKLIIGAYPASRFEETLDKIVK